MNRPDPERGPETRPTSETQARTYEEVPNNHLSPMGQVDDIGRFARGVGSERLTRWFRVGILVTFAVVGFLLAVALIG